MDLFKWVGRKKREEEWMRQPRLEPSFAKELPEDNDRWYVTQEFVNDDDKNLRCYMAVFQPDPKVENWRLYHVEYDLTKGEDHLRASWADETADPMHVVKELRGYERKMRNSAAFIAHPSEKPDYRPFANKYGIHFDDDGNIFRVKTEAPLTKGVFMNRESLETLFHKEAAKKIPLDDWEGIYKGVVEKISPEWTVTEKAFGLADNFKDVGAVPADNQYSKSLVEITPVASSVWEIAAAGGGVFNWKGGVETTPTAKDIAEAKAALESGAADRLAIEAASVEKPAETPAAEKPAEQPLPAVASSSDAKPEEKPALPPLPVRVNGKFIYNHAREKTWGTYPQMQQMTWQRPVTVDDMVKDPAYAEYASRMRLLMVRLNQLPATLSSPTASRYDKEAALSVLARYPFDSKYEGSKAQLAQHMCDATILVGMLRAGNALYKEQFGPGKKFKPEALQLISALGNVCRKFAEERLHIDPAEAQKVADVIAKGADPNGPALPLEKTFEKYAPPAHDPAPAPAPKAAKPTKKKPKPNSGWWD
jgi:hypothetical protein